MSGVGYLLPLLVAALVGACGDHAKDEGGIDAAFKRFVAASSKKDCLAGEAEAPNEALRKHLRRLCACSEAKILATPMRRDEGDEATNAKVRAADEACYKELGGAPGEGEEAKRNARRP